MKSYLFLFCLFLSCNIFAYDHIYNVNGINDDGETVEGRILTNVSMEDEDDNAYGQLTDEDGNVHSFTGRWVGNGRINGITDDGDTVELRIQ